VGGFRHGIQPYAAEFLKRLTGFLAGVGELPLTVEAVGDAAQHLQIRLSHVDDVLFTPPIG